MHKSVSSVIEFLVQVVELVSRLVQTDPIFETWIKMMRRFRQASVRTRKSRLYSSMSQGAGAAEKGSQSSPTEDSLQLYKRLVECEDSTIRAAIGQSIDVLTQAFRLYGPRGVFVSFNGGKDAVVIMHLARAALAKFLEDTGSPEERLRVIYFLNKKNE